MFFRDYMTYDDARRGVLRSALGALVVVAQGLFTGAAVADPYRDLFRAIELDDASKIRLLLLRGVSPNSPDPERGPAIVFAARQKSLSAVMALLENPATDVNVLNRDGENALMYAALYGELDLVKRLVARGAEVNKTGWTPLHYAASNGRLSVVEYLLSQNAYIDAASENGTTPLMMAARENQTAVARLLVNEGADPSLRNDAGLGAAEYLTRAGSPADAKWMQERAAEYLARYGTKAKPVPAQRR
jgi:ankyrin repeat protein